MPGHDGTGDRTVTGDSIATLSGNLSDGVECQDIQDMPLILASGISNENPWRSKKVRDSDSDFNKQTNLKSDAAWAPLT